MRNKFICFIVVVLVLAVGVGGLFLTNAIINSDMPDLWKWILLR